MKPRYRYNRDTNEWEESPLKYRFNFDIVDAYQHQANMTRQALYNPSDTAEPYYLYRVPGVPATGSRLKRFLCLHDWLLKFNRGIESEFECAKCGKSEVRKLAHMY